MKMNRTRMAKLNLPAYWPKQVEILSGSKPFRCMLQRTPNAHLAHCNSLFFTNKLWSVNQSHFKNLALNQDISYRKWICFCFKIAVIFPVISVRCIYGVSNGWQFGSEVNSAVINISVFYVSSPSSGKYYQLYWNNFNIYHKKRNNIRSLRFEQLPQHIQFSRRVSFFHTRFG
jgi:hypothetical protein